MFVYQFVDPDLRVEIFFEKDGTAENGDVDFEKGDIDISAHFYWRLKKTSCKISRMLFCCFFGDKK